MCHFYYLVLKLNDITDAAVNVDGGAKNVDCDLVISLLEGIVVLLRDALKDLKLITVAELTLKGVACTLVELAQVVAGLLIVRIFFSLWPLFNVPFSLACYQNRVPRAVYCRFRKYHPLRRHRYHWVCYFCSLRYSNMLFNYFV